MNKYNLSDVQSAGFRIESAARDLAIAWAKDSEAWTDKGVDNVRVAMERLGYKLTPIAQPAPAVTMVAEDDRPVTFATTEEGRR